MTATGLQPGWKTVTKAIASATVIRAIVINSVDGFFEKFEKFESYYRIPSKIEQGMLENR